MGAVLLSGSQAVAVTGFVTGSDAALDHSALDAQRCVSGTCRDGGSTRHADGAHATQADVAWLHSFDDNSTIHAAAITLHDRHRTPYPRSTPRPGGPAIP
ncbi:MAG TPA: hypothetical protein VK752_15460, partial [Bryobacteraceae bacterium]|nr:hypothetical protein [Bryobacteraceae bacterium]